VARVQKKAGVGPAKPGACGATEIVPGLWMGSAPTPVCARLGGYDVIVLASEYQPPATAFPTVKRIDRVPIDDSFEPREEDLMTAFFAGRRTAYSVASGNRVLVSCYMGRNRSGLISALAVRELLGVSGAQAARIVMGRRPIALRNPAFLNFLARLP
jgi:hypothetical protein